MLYGTYGYRAFPVAASRVWNSLPHHVTSAQSLPVFCSRLKIHLFIRSFLWLYCYVREVTLVIMDTSIFRCFYLLTQVLPAMHLACRNVKHRCFFTPAVQPKLVLHLGRPRRDTRWSWPRCIVCMTDAQIGLSFIWTWSDLRSTSAVCGTTSCVAVCQWSLDVTTRRSTTSSLNSTQTPSRQTTPASAASSASYLDVCSLQFTDNC